MQENLRKIVSDALLEAHKEAIAQSADAGKYIKEGYSGDISTGADLNIEKATIESLESSGISADIISEEKGRLTINSTGPAKYLITIDPLDGSSNFSHGRSILPYTTIVAIFAATKSPCFRDTVCAGIIEHTTKSIWLASRGGGATLNGTRCSASAQKAVDKSGKYATDFFHKVNWGTFEKLIEGRQKININDYGSSGLHYALLASGSIDAMMSASQKAHELSAGYLIAKESGATITDLSGKPLCDNKYDFDSKYTVIAAATQELHTEILKAISK